jgi:hypothetical protein
MRALNVLIVIVCFIFSTSAHALQVGYQLTITTAYADGDPFGNRIDTNFNEPDDGFFQVANTGDTVFTGTISTIAISSFAGDLSWVSPVVTVGAGQAVSVAIPDDAKAVGGFNGPFYYYRPGIEIALVGTISDLTGQETVNLLVADRDIHSGISRVDPFGLVSDSFVLQGGDPWGFNSGDAFALSQAFGVYAFTQPVPEPPVPALMGLTCLALRRRRFRCRGCARSEGRQSRVQKLLHQPLCA